MGVIMRILIVEDEKRMADALEYLLKKEKYQVDVCYDGEAGLDAALSNIYDAIVLDRMLPSIDGIQIMKEIRTEGLKVPVIFLTAKDTINDRVEGLDAGADDYLIKPFSNQEFLARIRSLLRRNETLTMESNRTVGKLTLDISKNICMVGTEQISLTKTEAQLLELFMRNQGQVLKKELILDRIWGFEKDIEIANVELYIYYLRKKVDFEKAGVTLSTVRGVGYLLQEV